MIFVTVCKFPRVYDLEKIHIFLVKGGFKHTKYSRGIQVRDDCFNSIADLIFQETEAKEQFNARKAYLLLFQI
jgi:hypothetical protein